MEWLDHFNNSIAYVEENLARSIDLYRSLLQYKAAITRWSLLADTRKTEKQASIKSTRGFFF